MLLFTFFTVAFHSSVMKDDGCSRKTAATINDINNNVKRGSVIKMTTMMNVTVLENNNNVNNDNKRLM